MVDPPASDASLDEWRRWSWRIGKGHLDPARLRAEAVRMRSGRMPLLRESSGVDLEVDSGAEMLTVDPGPLGPLERAGLVMFLTETRHRAAAGTAGDDHPTIRALAALAAAVEAGQVGPVDVPLRLTVRDRRELLFHVLRIGLERARADHNPVAEPLRRVLAGVELWAFGERGWQPDPQPDWPDDDGALFRGGRLA